MLDTWYQLRQAGGGHPARRPVAILPLHRHDRRRVHRAGRPLLAAGARLIDSIAAVLRGYSVGEGEMTHAIRTIRCTLHGFAALQASAGFQWSGDPDETFDWMIRFIDRGLRATPLPAAG
jgi:hypothetical protein